MANSARLCAQAFSQKPAGVPRANFHLSSASISQVAAEIQADTIEASYSSVISYVEALKGMKFGSYSWSVVKLYYSSFYCIKAFNYLSSIVPFNSGKQELLFDMNSNLFLAGGKSSHHWNWSSFRSVRRLTNWYYSEDSEAAYSEMRKYREDCNYRFPFSDPKTPGCLISQETRIERRFRTYRDDSGFFFTYLPDHLSLSYPTKLIFELDKELKRKRLALSKEQRKHLRAIWTLSDRCPLGD